MMLRELWWRVAGRPYAPPRPVYCSVIVNQYSGKEYMPRYMTMAQEYNCGLSVEEIADVHDVTMERVSQCLWKAYRAGNK